ncbi:MAG: hypothetical protein ACLFST_02380 [Spirochaetia bacterium]
MAAIKAGAATAVITPPAGLDLSGWSFGPSRGVHDDLYAKVLVLDDGTGPAVVITADLIGLGTGYADRFRKETAAKLNTVPGRILFSCSHTHSGPGAMKLRRWGSVDEEYLFTALEKIQTAVLEAYGKMKECRIASAAGMVRGICDNRRDDRRKAVDESLPVVRIEGKDGTPLAALFNYSCHPVAAHNDRNLISADYPGFARRVLEKELGCPVTLFTLGACGDVNPKEFHRIELAEHYGGEIGKAAAEVWRSMDSAAEDISIIIKTERISLPVRDLPSAVELEEEIVTREKEAAELERRGLPHKREDALIKLEWAREALETVRSGTARDRMEMEVGVLAIGDTAMVTLPGELFSEIGMNIKSRSPFRTTIISELTNGSFCYIPTASAFDRGGYETDFSAKVYGLYMLTRDAQEIVENAAERLLRSAADQKKNQDLEEK